MPNKRVKTEKQEPQNIEEPTLDDAQIADIDDLLDLQPSGDVELADDTADDTGSDEPADDGDRSGEEPSSEESQESESEPQAQDTPAGEQVFTIRGKRYTREELLKALQEDPSRIEDFAKSYEQLPHLQQKYAELLQRVQAMQQAGAVPPQQASSQPEEGRDPWVGTFYPSEMNEGIQAAMAPTQERLKKVFGVEDEFFEMYPGAARAMTFLAAAAEVAFPTFMAFQSDMAVNQARQVYQGLHQLIDQVAESGDLYEPLKTDEGKQQLLQYLVRLNPDVSQINEQLIKDAWIAANREAIEQQRLAAVQRELAQKQAERRMAMGPSAGAAAGPPPQKEEKAEWEELL